MVKVICMKSTVIPYSLVRSKRKTLCLQIDSKGFLTVKAPLRLSAQKIDEFVRSRERWIYRTLHQVKQSIDLALPESLSENTLMLVLGNNIPFCFYDGSIIHLDEALYFPAKKRGRNEVAYLKQWLKIQAHALLLNKTQEWSKKLNISFRSVSIGSARKRWGSCNSKRDLRYSWYLIMLPLRLIDYVVVHELVHIKQFNHSRQFWDEVLKGLPSAKELKKELQVYHIKKETVPSSPCLVFD